MNATKLVISGICLITGGYFLDELDKYYLPSHQMLTLDIHEHPKVILTYRDIPLSGICQDVINIILEYAAQLPSNAEFVKRLEHLCKYESFIKEKIFEFVIKVGKVEFRRLWKCESYFIIPHKCDQCTTTMRFCCLSGSDDDIFDSCYLTLESRKDNEIGCIIERHIENRFLPFWYQKSAYLARQLYKEWKKDACGTIEWINI